MDANPARVSFLEGGIYFLLILLFYHQRYGLQILLPTKTAWLMRDDWATHYLGWYFYRFEPWTFPLGSIQNYYYPIGTNVGFTDSIPLLAIPLKLLSPLLPENFQYLGFWLFSCHLLMAWSARKLFHHLGFRGWLLILAVLFLVFNPVLIHRDIHPALCAHWLIILNLWVYLLDSRQHSLRGIFWYQWTLLIISALLNPYLCSMIGGFLFFNLLKIWIAEQQITWKGFLGYLGSSLASLLLVWVTVGYIGLENRETYEVAQAYGLYSLNLDALFNPWGYSRLLPSYPAVSWHQYESFMYLGAGVILLVILTVFFGFIRIRSLKKANYKILLLFIFAFLLLVFSVTNRVTWHDQVVLEMPWPDFLLKLGNIFRASARFFWLVYYFILVGALYVVWQFFPRKIIAHLLIILAFTIQIYDLRPFLQAKKFKNQTYNIPLSEDSWRAVFKNFGKISFYPPYEANYLSKHDYIYFSRFAAEARNAINLGYVARANGLEINNSRKDIQAKLINNEIQDTSLLFVSIPAHRWRFLVPMRLGTLRYFHLDGYDLFYPASKKDDIFLKLIRENPQAITKLPASYEPSSLEKTKEAPIDTSRKIKYAFDELISKTDYVYLSGWAFVENDNNSQDNNTSLLLIAGSGEIYKSQSLKIERPDIATHFQNQRLLRSGFVNTFTKDQLEPGVYQVGLYITDGEQGSSSYIITQENVEISVSKPEHLEIVPSLTKNLKYSFSYEDGEGTFSCKGWAFPNHYQANHQQISLIFASENQIYKIPTQTVFRPDVGESFQNEQLNHTGYRVSVDKSAFQDGDYQVGLYLSDTLRGESYFAWTGYKIPLQSQKWKLVKNLPSSEEKIRYHLEQEHSPEFVRLKGWAFLPKTNTQDTQIKIALRSGQRQYLISTKPVLREDVSKHFDNPLLDHSGFQLKISKAKLKSDQYQVGIYIEHFKNSQESLTWTDQILKQ